MLLLLISLSGQGFHNEEAGFLIDEGVIVVSVNYRQASFVLLLLTITYCFCLYYCCRLFIVISTVCLFQNPTWNNSRLGFMGFLSLDIEQACGNQVYSCFSQSWLLANKLSSPHVARCYWRGEESYNVNCKAPDDQQHLSDKIRVWETKL